MAFIALLALIALIAVIALMAYLIWQKSFKSIEAIKATLSLKLQMSLAIIAITIKPVNTAIASALFYRLVLEKFGQKVLR